MTKIALLAVLSLASLVGCKQQQAAGADCASALDNAMKVSRDELAQHGVEAAGMDRIKAASLASCSKQAWSSAVRTCLADAKTAADVTGCQDKLTTEQRDGLARAVTGAMDVEQPEPGPGSAGSAGSATAAAPDGAGLPPECDEYRALIDKVAGCEQLPQASRDALVQGFDAMTKPTGAVSNDYTATLSESCKTSAAALRTAAGELCGI